MKISIIAAMSRNRVIGINNTLPWHLPADLKHFKSITMGKAIVMGRKTFESIGRPLPGRTNIIITRNTGFQAEGCTVVHSIEDALDLSVKQDEIMIIGGASFYEQILPRADRIYLTLIDEKFEGDALFPKYNQSDWQETEHIKHMPDEKNKYQYSFIVLNRKT